MRHLFSLIFSILIFAACSDSNSCFIDNGIGNDASNPSLLVESEISNGTVYSIVEDSQGFIWMGTKRGLNRFDGHDFYQYFFNPDDSTSLPDNQVYSLLSDSKGRLWVGTITATVRYTDQDNFHVIPNEGPSPIAWQFVESPDGRIFANYGSVVSLYDEENDIFRVVIPVGNVSYSPRMFFDRRGTLWFLTGGQLHQYEVNHYQQLQNIPLPNYVSNCAVTGDSLWLAGDDGLHLFNLKSSQFEDLPVELNPIRSKLSLSGLQVFAKESGDALMFVAREGFACIYSRSKGRIYTRFDEDCPFIIPIFPISCIVSDSNDNIWIGSSEQGYQVVYSNRNRFAYHQTALSQFFSMSVQAVTTDHKGRLWTGTQQQGLFLYDPNTGLRRRFVLSDILPGQNLEKVSIYHLFVDSTDALWMLVSDSHVLRCRYDASSQSLRCEAQFNVFVPLSVAEDAQHNIWIGSYSRYLFFIRNGSDRLEAITANEKDEFCYISSMRLLHDGRLACAISHGGYIKVADPDSMTLHPMLWPKDDMNRSMKTPNFLPNILFEDSKGLLWIGTMGNGLLCYNPKADSLWHVSGAPCEDVVSIEEDSEGNLWVGTLHGLGKYDRIKGQFVNFFKADGTGGNQFYDRASCRLIDGSLAFGGAHGLTCFNPSDINETSPVPVYIEDLKVWGHSVRPGDNSPTPVRMTLADKVHLNYCMNSISINYTAVDYNEYEHVHYEYMMEGLDPEWIKARNSRSASYSELPAGNYVFRVRAVSADRDNVLGERMLELEVDPAPWRTWWAYLIYFFIAAAIIYALIRQYYHIQKVRLEALQAQREKLHEQEINRMNMNFFANVSHEFRTPLTMIAGPMQQLVQDKSFSARHHHLFGIMQQSVERMLRLVNQMLDFNKFENGARPLAVRQQDVTAMLRRYVDMFRVEANEKGLTLTDQGLEESVIAWVDADVIDKVTCNLLSNAVKYNNPNGTIEFAFDIVNRSMVQSDFIIPDSDPSEQYLRIDVADTGQGVPDNQLERIFERYYQLNGKQHGHYNFGTGIGLYYARALAQLHHGYLKAFRRPDGRQGTLFSLLIPTAREVYSDNEILSGATTDQSTLFPSDQSIHRFDVEESQTDGKEDRLTILVVDDDVDVTRYLRALLGNDYKIICQYSADAAYATMQDSAPDMVLSDVSMPGRDGYSLCKQIKEDLQLCHIPVILVTAKAATGDQVEGLNSGADAYVTKPFDPVYLQALIKSLFENRERQRRLLSDATEANAEIQSTLSAPDQAFMKELYQLMEKELDNPELDILHLTDMMKISRTKFYYKVKGLMGENPAAFFKRYKLNRAAELLKSGKHTIAEVAFMTGFSSASSFSNAFKKHFGVSPSDYK